MMVALDDHLDAAAASGDRGPPQSRATGSSPAAAQDRVVAEAGDDQRPVALPEAAQRRQVHMVVMIVADEDEVDPRQVLEADAGRAHPARADEGERRGALRPDRIGEDVEALGLDEHGGMADPGDQHLVARDAARRHGRPDRHLLGPGGALAAADQRLRKRPRIEPAAARARRD